MGYLDDYINNPMKLHKRKFIKSIPTLLNLIRTNKFNHSNPRHVRMKNVGIKYGYIDQDLNILKGV